MARTIRKIERQLPQIPVLERVAAYARVSTEKDSMMHSLSAQVSYYSELIQRNPKWIYAGVYADNGLSGTSADRPEFQRLLADCRAGKIDRILTKSISRFTRNTLTLLETTRELKALGIDVYFEKENLHSISKDGELMLSIIASFAQEESRSVSDNMKWSIRKRFQKGELVNWRFMYGYRIRKGHVTIHEQEAEVVRWVYEQYLGGRAVTIIAQTLRERSIPLPFGGEWTPNRIVQLLKNEKYAGNALLQKPTWPTTSASRKNSITASFRAILWKAPTRQSSLLWYMSRLWRSWKATVRLATLPACRRCSAPLPA